VVGGSIYDAWESVPQGYKTPTPPRDENRRRTTTPLFKLEF
jgi:hypothetical protein